MDEIKTHFDDTLVLNEQLKMTKSDPKTHLYQFKEEQTQLLANVKVLETENDKGKLCIKDLQSSLQKNDRCPAVCRNQMVGRTSICHRRSRRLCSSSFARHLRRRRRRHAERP